MCSFHLRIRALDFSQASQRRRVILVFRFLVKEKEVMDKSELKGQVKLFSNSHHPHTLPHHQVQLLLFRSLIDLDPGIQV